MRPHLRWLKIIIISTIAVCGCTVYQKPRLIHDVAFMERSQSKVNDEVRVTVAVLTAEESRDLFGVNLAGQGIQPVWVRVQNADTIPYWLLSTALDPDYFSPLESAYAFHGTFSSSINDKIDPDVDEAGLALIKDLVYSQKLARAGWVKGVGAASRAKPRYNLTGDPYFTDGYRVVLVFDRRPRSFLEIANFDWEQPVSNRIERLDPNREPDFDEN